MVINYIIVILGGVESRSVILYVIPIIMSAATLGRKGIYGATALSLLSYNFIFIDYYRHAFRPGGPFRTDLPEILYTMVFATTALIAVLLAMDYIIRLLRQKERQALKTVEDIKRAQAVGRFGNWELDIRTNKVTCSDEVYRLIGIPPGPADLALEYYMSFVHPKDRRLLKVAVKRASRQPKRFSFDYRILATNGELRYLHAEGESISDRSGRVSTIIGTVRDTTEERMLDESRNEFVSLASHQLRTPATVIKQYLGMLLDGYAGELTEKQKVFIKTASDTNERQIDIVNNLLDVAQLESGKIQLTLAQVDLLVLIKELVEGFKPQANEKQQTLEFTSRYKRLYCQADWYYLRTVLENILDNALRYTTRHKSVTVKLTKEANAVVIAVIDQGVGITAEDLPKLFKKFSRIENVATFQEEGAGLGLYWSKKVVALHGGRLEAESVYGKGTTFRIILPLADKPKKVRPRIRRRAGQLTR
jgi:signal transduction histidine kinase